MPGMWERRLMYALIGSLFFGGGTNSSRLDSQFNVKATKINYILNFCQQSKLTPVIVGHVLEKTVSVKMIYETIKVLREHDYAKEILIVSEDYRLEMLASMIGAKIITPESFNQSSSIIKIHNDNNPETDDNGQFKYLIKNDPSFVGNKVYKSKGGVIEVSLGSLYRKNFDDSSKQVGFITIIDNILNEELLKSESDNFVRYKHLEQDRVGSSSFVSELSGFADKEGIEQERLNSIIKDELFNSGSTDFIAKAIDDLMTKADTSI